MCYKENYFQWKSPFMTISKIDQFNNLQNIPSNVQSCYSLVLNNFLCVCVIEWNFMLVD